MTELRVKHIEEVLSKKRKLIEVAEIHDVSRQTASKWKAKYLVEGPAGLSPRKSGPKNGTAWNITSGEVEDIICEIADRNPFKGTIWITDQLEEEYGFKIDQSTAYRVLKRKGKRYGQGYWGMKRKKKHYVLDTPGRELQMDVLLPFGHSRPERVFDAIDDCSRWIFSKVMNNHSQASAIAFVKQLLHKAPFPIEAIRTDQGREFSKEFTAFLESHGIEHRKNPPYTPQHNGKIERYHRTLRENELCYWNTKADAEELNYRLWLWTSNYNTKRRHSGLGMYRLTPYQKIAYATIRSSFQLNHQNVNLTLQQNSF